MPLTVYSFRNFSVKMRGCIQKMHICVRSSTVKTLLQKRVILLLGILVFWGVTMPFLQAHASCGLNFVCAIGEAIGNYIIILPATVLAVIFIVINAIMQLIVLLTGFFMNIVIHWIQVVPYTPLNQALQANQGHDAITAGWQVMRDLADMGLIFVLIAIAVATILQLSFAKGGEGKLILKFVGAAIIINFSPLICGVIIDIANILTQIFFQNAQDGWRMFLDPQNVTSITALLSQIPDAVRSANATNALSVLFSSMLSIVFAVAQIAAFVTMSLLLLARVLALWILVILSPIAFLMYVLPATEKTFKSWWHNFLQWVMLPIPLGIFFWLSTQLTQSATVLCGTSSWDVTTNAGSVSGDFSTLIAGIPLLSSLCQPMIILMAIAMLFVGFFISFSFSAMGSRLVVSKGTQWGTNIGTSVLGGRIGKLAQRAAGTRAGQWTGRKVGGAIPAPVKAFGTRVAASKAGKAAGGAYKYAKMGQQKAYQYGQPLATKGLEKMGKKGGVIGAMGQAMAAGVYAPPPAKSKGVPYATALQRAGLMVPGGVPPTGVQPPPPPASQQQALIDALNRANNYNAQANTKQASYQEEANKLASQRVEEQIARLIILVQNGMGILVSTSTLTKKDREEMYKKVSTQLERITGSQEMFQTLAKRIPDIVQNAPIQVLQKTYNIAAGKTEEATRKEARSIMHSTLIPEDFEQERAATIPEEYVKRNVREIVGDVKQENLGMITDAVINNAKYSESTRKQFGRAVDTRIWGAASATKSEATPEAKP